MDLNERFITYHQSKNTFSESKKVLVAFSGGKDSLCLLTLLRQYEAKLEIKVGACHVHHMIRGEEADREMDFCREVCEDLGIPFFAEKVDVPAFCKKNGVGLEEGARAERYRLLTQIAEAEGYDLIATAHSASDQAETVLFRMIRGSGIAGTRGIAERRDKFIRPLLPFYQEEIVAYLRKHQLTFTKDSSNDDILYSRNRLRNVILPEMKKINPSVEKALVRFGNLSSYQHALCVKLCDQIEKSQNFQAVCGKVPLSVLTEYAKDEADFPLLYEFLSRMAQNENISIDFDRFLSLVSLLKRPIEGKIIEISNGFSFLVKKNTLIFAKHETPLASIEYEMTLQEGTNSLPAFGEILHVSAKKQGKVININKKGLIIHIASDKMEGKLVARNFRNGDKIRMYGMNKRIKKLFCDAGIPSSLRNRIPLVCDDKEVVWLPFFGLCDKARDEKEGQIRTLSLSGEALSPIETIVGSSPLKPEILVKENNLSK